MSILNALMGAAGVGPSTPEPTFVSSSTNRAALTNSNTVGAPTGIQNGDLLIAVGFNMGDPITGITAPTGFSVTHFSSDATTAAFLATKTASSESGSYAFTWTGTAANNTIAILVYRNATQVNTMGTITKVGATATITAASITPTFNGTLCCLFAAAGNHTVATAPSGMTQRAAQTTTNPSVAVYDLSGQPASATTARSLVWSATGALLGFQFFVTNEANIAPEFIASSSADTAANSFTLVINKPTGTVAGDLMIAVMACDAASRSWTGDTDWVEVADQGADPNLRVAYKVAGGSEPSSYTFTLNGQQKLTGCIMTYRYAAYDTVAGSFTSGANPLLLASISPTQSQSTLIACGARSATSTTLGTPTSMTARVTDANLNDPSYIVCEQKVPKGATGPRSMSTGSTTNVAGIMLAIKPTRTL